MTKLREDLNDFLEKWDKATEEHNRSEKVSEALKPVFFEDNFEDNLDDIWEAMDVKEKVNVLERSGYDIIN